MEINQYAEHTIYVANFDPAEHTRISKWRPVSHEEMKLFFAVVFAMGLVNKLDLQDYWSSDKC